MLRVGWNRRREMELVGKKATKSNPKVMRPTSHNLYSRERHQCSVELVYPNLRRRERDFMKQVSLIIRGPRVVDAF